jgi:signal transduction histidine kinase
MDTSVGQLHAGLDGRRLDDALRDRVAELSALSDARIEMRGEAPPLPATVTVHAYRVVAEALLNAVRHAGATRIEVALEQRDGWLRAHVSDDGRGIPANGRPGSHGLSFMGHRASTIGGRLRVGRGDGDRGTSVVLDVPLDKESVQ